MKNFIFYIVILFLTYNLSNIIYDKSGFQYNIFTESFNFTKLLIDIVIFACCYIINYLTIKYIIRKYKQLRQLAQII